MIEFRNYREDEEKNDSSSVLALHQETEQAIGKKMDLPNLADHPVLIAEVAEKHGEVKGALYLESVPECCFIGRDAEVTVSAVRHAPEILARLKAHGFRVVRLQVPKALPERERKMIRQELGQAGFHCTDELYEHFCLDMRG